MASTFRTSGTLDSIQMQANMTETLSPAMIEYDQQVLRKHMALINRKADKDRDQ